jgi:hypothetical protein
VLTESDRRPILFRSSSAQLTSAFQNTRYPHGTVTSSDAFSVGLIRSSTDFEVYSTAGEMEGLDVSFYINRDKYHTMQDTIENLNGKQPLWTMLEMARDVGYSIANSEDDEENEKPVYWDSMWLFFLFGFLLTSVYSPGNDDGGFNSHRFHLHTLRHLH